jgi:hypothetical protein
MDMHSGAIDLQEACQTDVKPKEQAYPVERAHGAMTKKWADLPMLSMKCTL